ncbi:hypothetical protein KAR91_87495 [Candidatus Pacearchaeota archaeon]|nr:hypothetical protein [Candidatus Pacearchaeota archaeon]
MPLDTAIEDLRAKAQEAKARMQSEIQGIKARTIGGQGLISGRGSGLLGNSGVAGNLRSKVQERASVLAQARPLQRMAMGRAPRPTDVTPDTPLRPDGRPLPAVAPAKVGPSIGGRSDGGGKLNVRPVIGGT